MSKEQDALREVLLTCLPEAAVDVRVEHITKELAKRGYAIVFQPEDGVQND